MKPEQLVAAAAAFRSHARSVFGRHEEAGQARVHLLTDSYKRLTALSLKQDDLLRQALRCAELSVYRAAHVLAWAATADFLQDYAGDDGFKALKAARPKWSFNELEELREAYTEFAIIEGMKLAKLLTKTQMKAFHGLLAKRNECAHPSEYYPDINQTLGYISEIMHRIEQIQKKRSI